MATLADLRGPAGRHVSPRWGQSAFKPWHVQMHKLNLCQSPKNYEGGISSVSVFVLPLQKFWIGPHLAKYCDTEWNTMILCCCIWLKQHLFIYTFINLIVAAEKNKNSNNSNKISFVNLSSLVSNLVIISGNYFLTLMKHSATICFASWDWKF